MSDVSSTCTAMKGDMFISVSVSSWMTRAMLSIISFCMMLDIPLKTVDDPKCSATVVSNLFLASKVQGCYNKSPQNITILCNLFIVLLYADASCQTQSLINPDTSKLCQFHSTVDVAFGFTVPLDCPGQVGKVHESCSDPGIVEGARILFKKKTRPAK